MSDQPENIIKPAGYIVTDNEVIWSKGDTAEAAWDALLSFMAIACIQVIDDREYRSTEQQEEDEIAVAEGGWTMLSNFHIQSASAALLADVESRGGDIAWSSVDGVCCTRDEEDEAGDITDTHNLVLCADDDGWSLHPPGSTDEDIAAGDAAFIVCGAGRPTQADYDEAAALAP